MQAGIKMEFIDLAYRVPNILSNDECQTFIKYFESRKILSTTESSLYAGDGTRKNSNFKVIELSDNADLYKLAIDKQQSALQKWVDYLDNKNYFSIHVLKKLLKFPHKVRILKYTKGQSIHPHIDWNHFTHASVVLNLNSDYEGGEFAFLNGKYKISLAQGEALVFPADIFWVHEVKPVITGTRYSINSFIKSVPDNLAVDHINKIYNNFDISNSAFHIN